MSATAVRWASVLAGGVMVSTALVGPPVSVAPSAAQLSIGYMDQLFGARRVLEFVYPDRTSLVAAGTATVPDPPVPGALHNDELVVGGAIEQGGIWWVRFLQAYLLPESGCNTDVERQLVPGGRVVMAQCLNGGTGGQGFIA